MTFSEFFLRGIGKFKPAKGFFQSLCRYAVVRTGLRNDLNRFYNRLNYKERVFFHYLFSDIFRNRPAPAIDARWQIRFNQKTIHLPLQTETLWLDWDLAVSIVGHDVEVKSFYERFINGMERPANFFDIGANYGTHSLLFLSQGCQAVTFEPNPECQPFFRRFLQLNSLQGRWEPVAVGEGRSNAELVFPKNDTWNGSLQKNYQQELAAYKDLISIQVPVISVDDYVSETNIWPDIIKIDTEGFELNVLKGARKTLEQSHPVIIFESNKPAERNDLFSLLAGLGFQVYDLEEFFVRKEPLASQGFTISRQVNFVAVKENVLLTQPGKKGAEAALSR